MKIVNLFFIMVLGEQSKETPSEVSTSHSESDDDEEENASAIIKYIAPKTTQAMGEWEAHTKVSIINLYYIFIKEKDLFFLLNFPFIKEISSICFIKCYFI